MKFRGVVLLSLIFSNIVDKPKYSKPLKIKLDEPLDIYGKTPKWYKISLYSQKIERIEISERYLMQSWNFRGHA
jgi:hypothetical protein